jgi:hypothetical protein
VRDARDNVAGADGRDSVGELVGGTVNVKTRKLLLSRRRVI